MKIGVFSNYYPPMERGGAELVAQRVADELSRRGHQVFVLSTTPFSGPRSLRPEALEYHVERVYRFFPFNLYHLSNAHHYPFPLRLLWHLIDVFGPFPHQLIDRLLSIEEPDVMLTHNLKGFGIRASRCIQEAGIRQIHTIHDVQLSVPSGLLIHGQEDAWLNRGWPRRLYERIVRRALGQPDVIVSPSKFLAEFYQQRGFFHGADIRVLPNPAPKPLSSVTRPASAQTTAIRFLFVGQLEEHKGVNLLLQAIDRLEFSFELHVVGEGRLLEHVTARAKRDARVYVHGFISLEHIKKMMAQADAVVIPSLCYENSPTVIYESFQIGTPVLASRIGGIPELVTDGKTGLLFEPGSVASLVSSLQRLAREREFFWNQQTEIKKIAEGVSLRQYVDQLEKMISSPEP
jgi:glycosyltransferase involved in cell wall biosynthesis